jgi:hypothetical protein
MDRAAKLAEAAKEYIELEPLCFLSPQNGRRATRRALAGHARELGFDSKTEISAAIDQALKDAGTGP